MARSGWWLGRPVARPAQGASDPTSMNKPSRARWAGSSVNRTASRCHAALAILNQVLLLLLSFAFCCRGASIDSASARAPPSMAHQHQCTTHTNLLHPLLNSLLSSVLPAAGARVPRVHGHQHRRPGCPVPQAQAQGRDHDRAAGQGVIWCTSRTATAALWQSSSSMLCCAVMTPRSCRAHWGNLAAAATAPVLYTCPCRPAAWRWSSTPCSTPAAPPTAVA